MLSLQNVSRSVDGERYLEGVSLDFLPGSFTVLLGRTRAGKTSLLRVLAGLDRPSAGTLHWNGVDVTRAEVRKRDVAMVYQQFVNYPSFTVYDNIASPLRVQKKLARTELDKRVRDTAALLRIDGFLHRLPAELSGGQQQRTAIARALAKQAGLLLLDEPLANLDYKLREELRTELRGLFRKSNAVVVYATAEPSEALLLGGRTVLLDEGRVLQSGPALEVYETPVSERVGQVFSDPQMNSFDVELGHDGIAHISERVWFRLREPLPGLAPGRFRLGVRANHVTLSRQSARDVSFPAVVSAQEVSGSETLLHATSDALTLAALLPGVQRHALGTAITLYVEPSHLFVFDAAGKLLSRAAAPLPPSLG
ncbi:MAG: hypothetical protein RLZZ450_6821 [Pseudomonadota bacterium]|jgi:glycerol transport system ATP-binding protein